MVLKVPAKVSQFCYCEQAGDKKNVRCHDTVSLWKDMVEQSHLANNGGRKKKDEREGEEYGGRERGWGKGFDPQRHNSKDLPPVSTACVQRFPSVHNMPLNYKYISGLVH